MRDLSVIQGLSAVLYGGLVVYAAIEIFLLIF